MTYVTEQTPKELRQHMRQLQKMPGWHAPLDDRSTRFSFNLSLIHHRIANERLRRLPHYRSTYSVRGAAMIKDDIPDNPYMTDSDGDWTSRVWKGIKFSLATAAIVLLLSWLLNRG